MQRLKMNRLFRILYLAPIALIVNVLLTVVLVYFVLVFDIYINTEKLSKVDDSFNKFCQNIASNPNFTKGPVVFKIDRGTLVYRLYPYINTGALDGYAPFFIFPHNKTIVLIGESLKKDRSAMKQLVAHELGHIQGGIGHLGPSKEMEKYANSFAAKVVKTQPKKEPQK